MSAPKSSSEADGLDSPSAHVQSSTAKTGKQSTGGSPPNTRQGGQATPQQPSEGGNSTQSRPATRLENAELISRNSLKETGPATSRHSSARIKSRASDGVDPASETTPAAENEHGVDHVEQLSQAARSRSSTHREKERIEDKHLDPEVNEEKDKEDEKFASDAAFNRDVLGMEPYSSGSRVDVAGVRAVLDFGPEGCSCFPSRSSHTVPSMLYDQVHCLHCHVTGHAHVGVFQFDDNWDASVRNVKSTDRHPPTKKYISGYPYFQLSEFQKDDHSPGKEKAHNTTTEKSWEGQQELQGNFDVQGKGDEETIKGGDKLLLPSSAMSRCVQSRATTVKPRSLLKLKDPSPNITHEREATPVPSRGEKTLVPVTLEMPSPGASQTSLVETYSTNTTPPGKFVSKSRTFRGRFYDPATDECYIFDITPDFGRQLDQWTAHKELTRQRTHGTNKTKRDN